jgi:hypothetical protein
MQISFPTSIPTIQKVDVSSVYTGFDCLLKYDGFVSAFRKKAEDGASIIHFGGEVPGYDKALNPDTIIGWHQRFVSKLIGNRRGVLISPENPADCKTWYRQYQKACKDPNVSVIVIAATPSLKPSIGEHLRIVYLNRLVKEGLFCIEKTHWLYGVPNPAELAVYSNLFSNFIASRFELAICATCFIYSIFGIPFSALTGVMERLPERMYLEDLGMESWITYEMSREQLRCFFLNVDRVQEFASGQMADRYMDIVHTVLWGR